MIIYKATNRANGKIYIGKTTRSLKRRLSEHFKSEKGYFPNALRKYGLQGFEFTKIENCKSENSLNEREMYWISFFGCKYPGGYNLTDGGEGMSGFSPSEATRKKLSNALGGLTRSDDTRKKMSLSRQGIVFSENHRKNISEANRRRIFSAETRAKMSAAHKGVPMSESARENISKAAKARVLNFPMPYMKGRGKQQLFKNQQIQEVNVL
ncbi:MAG: GIY-YIG nuclease family protein [Synergistaceae bacterium]|jgi:group I intron endonuclease